MQFFPQAQYTVQYTYQMLLEIIFQTFDTKLIKIDLSDKTKDMD
jgi:hypothetical protein